MKTIVISYSLTGNNKALATSIASEFGAKHIKVTESKARTVNTIIIDILFNRTPQISPVADQVEDADLVIFVGPVWMGRVATPLRAYFKHFKTRPRQYAFISISGGADGGNPKLIGELKKRVGKEPAALIDLHITDLLPSNPKYAWKDASGYLLSDSEIKSLTTIAMKTLRETIVV